MKHEFVRAFEGAPASATLERADAPTTHAQKGVSARRGAGAACPAPAAVLSKHGAASGRRATWAGGGMREGKECQKGQGVAGVGAREARVSAGAATAASTARPTRPRLSLVGAVRSRRPASNGAKLLAARCRPVSWQHWPARWQHQPASPAAGRGGRREPHPWHASEACTLAECARSEEASKEVRPRPTSHLHLLRLELLRRRRQLHSAQSGRAGGLEHLEHIKHAARCRQRRRCPPLGSWTSKKGAVHTVPGPAGKAQCTQSQAQQEPWLWPQ